MGDLNLQRVRARWLGRRERPYGSFTDGRTGQTVAGGVKQLLYVWVTDEPYEMSIAKDAVIPAELPFGSEVDVEYRTFASGNRLRFTVSGVEPAKAGVASVPTAKSA